MANTRSDQSHLAEKNTQRQTGKKKIAYKISDTQVPKCTNFQPLLPLSKLTFAELFTIL